MDTEGSKVGRHDGLMYYTLGQRRGIGLGGTVDSQERWFVVEKDLKNNRLIVSHGDQSVLMSKALVSNAVNWIPENLLRITLSVLQNSATVNPTRK